MAQGQLHAREKFQVVIYLAYGGVSTNSGLNADAPKPFADGDLWNIPAYTLIEKVYVLVDVIITGTTVLEVGDDDDANGFVVDLASGLGTVGLYGWDAKTAGAYLRVESAGGTDALDIYVVPQAKAYLAAGKEVKLNITTANTAGKARVVIEGHYFGGYAA